MKLNRIAVLLPIFLACSGYGQSSQANHNSATPITLVRMKALQNQVKNQQAEIDALRLRFGKLQQEIQELTQMVVDQETDAGSDDDDSADDPGGALWLAHSQTRPLRSAHSRNAVWTGKKNSSCQAVAAIEDSEMR